MDANRIVLYQNYKLVGPKIKPTTDPAREGEGGQDHQNIRLPREAINAKQRPARKSSFES